MNAGKIDRDWFEAARMNGDVGDDFCRLLNASVGIDAELSVWVHSSGRWLTQEQIDDVCKMIDVESLA